MGRSTTMGAPDTTVTRVESWYPGPACSFTMIVLRVFPGTATALTSRGPASCEK